MLGATRRATLSAMSARDHRAWALGRALVTPCRARRDAIQFTRAHTRTRASAEDFCREKNIPLAASYDDILADPEIDAVVLATPHSQHETQVRQAAAAGKHIHVEKPITLDYGRARVPPSRPRSTPASCWRSASAAASIRPSSISAGGSPTAGSAKCCPWWRSTPPRPASSSRRQLARRARGGAGRRAHRGGRAFARPHDRVRRPRARCRVASPRVSFRGRPTIPPP